MRGHSFNPDDQTRVQILAGLIELRKGGYFVQDGRERRQIRAIDAGNCLRIQFEPEGRWKLIGWRRAWEMVASAKQALEAAILAETEAERKPPASEGLPARAISAKR